MDRIKLAEYTRLFLEGNLPEEQEAELLFWIKKDGCNQKLFLKEQEKQSVNSIAQKNQSRRIWNKTCQKIFVSNKKERKHRFFIRVASIAAAFVLGAILAVAILNYPPALNHRITQQNISVPYGAKTKIVLPDSSSVWLNSGSSFSYPSEFGKTRAVQLIGEAFFKVTKSNNPFVVATRYGEVEVKGTSFNVHAFPDEAFQTTLEEGAVLVREKGKHEEFALRPGQQALLNSGGHLTVKSVETELYTSWKEGKLIFRKEYLPAVVKRLERWYNIKIEMENDSRLNEIWFNGTLEMESFSEVMDLLHITSPIEYTYNPKTRTIKIKYKQK